MSPALCRIMVQLRWMRLPVHQQSLSYRLRCACAVWQGCACDARMAAYGPRIGLTPAAITLGTLIISLLSVLDAAVLQRIQQSYLSHPCRCTLSASVCLSAVARAAVMACPHYHIVNPCK